MLKSVPNYFEIDFTTRNHIYSDLGGLNFYEDSDGNKYVVGADSVPKKLGNPDIEAVSYTKSGAGTEWSSTSYTADSCGFSQFTGGAITNAGYTRASWLHHCTMLTFSSDMKTATISTMSGEGYERTTTAPVSFTLYGIK